MDEGRAGGADTKADTACRYKPTRPYPLAQEIQRDLKQDVGDIKDGERNVKVVTLHLQVGL